MTSSVPQHYSTGGLYDRMVAALKEAGQDLSSLAPEDLAAGEHFHTGGAAATAAFIAQLDVGPDTHVLDIGCGIGGVSRAIAHATGARVTGIDLTPDFVETACKLSKLVGLDHLTEFQVASADKLPVNDRFFDMAVMVHVGMNIPDKAAIFAEAHRALHPGGGFAIFEVMTGPEPGDLEFPMPWATCAEQSHVVRPADYRDVAMASGFSVLRVHNKRDAVLVQIGDHDIPPTRPVFGPHLMMGPTYDDKVRNYNSALRAGRLAPVEMFFSRST